MALWWRQNGVMVALVYALKPEKCYDLSYLPIKQNGQTKYSQTKYKILHMKGEKANLQYYDSQSILYTGVVIICIL